MPFTFTTGEYNVQGSLNKFILNNLGSSLPTWMTSLTLNFDYPNIPLTFPSFSVTYFPTREIQRFEGDRAEGSNKGVTKKGIVEINGWIDSTSSQDYQMRLRQMKDMIEKLFRQNPAISILDIYSSTSNPQATGYILRITDINELQVNQDPNPAVKRVRMQIGFIWTERF